MDRDGTFYPAFREILKAERGGRKTSRPLLIVITGVTYHREMTIFFVFPKPAVSRR